MKLGSEEIYKIEKHLVVHEVVEFRESRQRERERDGVRCDIDDKPVCLSVVSPWLNVRSQWKGGTTNATKSLWQVDPWERKYPFNKMPILPSAPFLPNLLSASFILVMSNASLLNLCFSLYRLQYHQLFCPLCSLSPFPPYTHICIHTHKDTGADLQLSLSWQFPWALDLMSQMGNKDAIKRTPEDPHSAFVPSHS